MKFLLITTAFTLLTNVCSASDIEAVKLDVKPNTPDVQVDTVKTKKSHKMTKEEAVKACEKDKERATKFGEKTKPGDEKVMYDFHMEGIAKNIEVIGKLDQADKNGNAGKLASGCRWHANHAERHAKKSEKQKDAAPTKTENHVHEDKGSEKKEEHKTEHKAPEHAKTEHSVAQQNGASASQPAATPMHSTTGTKTPQQNGAVGGNTAVK